MNREIKFRVWDKVNKRFLTDSTEPAIYIKFDGQLTSIDTVGREIYDFEKNEKQNFVVQQYTGIKDKNGKEIYEGDLVAYTERMHEHGDTQHLIGEVIYEDYWGAFGLGRNGEIWNFFSDYSIKSNLLIVGNIFESPEALNLPDLDKLTNRCLKCNRIVVGLKPGDMHDHTEVCNDCGRIREMKHNTVEN